MELRIWDNFEVWFQVGPRVLEVKDLVKTYTLPGGGLKGAKIGAWDPLGWSENHHQVVVVVVSAGAAGETATLHVSLRAWEMLKKISKNLTIMDSQTQASIQQVKTSSNP